MQSHKRSPRAVEQLSLDGKFIAKHISIGAAAKAVSGDAAAIGRVCRKKMHKTKGFKWQFADADKAPIPATAQNELESLYAEVINIIKDYCVLKEHDYDILTCWIITTYFVSVTHKIPRLVITAPTRACGKSQVLKVTTALTTNSQKMTPPSEAVIVRMPKEEEPVFLIDECDDWFQGMDKQLLRVLKDGWERGGTAMRCDPNDDMRPKAFPIYMPIVMAGINIDSKMCSTLLSRCIVIGTEKTTVSVKDGELIQMIETLRPLRKRLTDAANKRKPDYLKGHVPNHSDNRIKDVWGSLFGIADMSGKKAQAGILKAYQAVLASYKDDDVNLKALMLTRTYLDDESVRRKSPQGRQEEYASVDDLFNLISQDAEYTELTNPFTKITYLRIIIAFGVSDFRQRFASSGNKSQGLKLDDLLNVFDKYLGDSGGSQGTSEP